MIRKLNDPFQDFWKWVVFLRPGKTTGCNIIKAVYLNIKDYLNYKPRQFNFLQDGCIICDELV